MTIRVMFFGATADIAGRRDLDLEIEDDESLGAVVDRLSERFPALTEHTLLLAVNEEYADEAALVSKGDDVAIFTAVSGG